MQKYKLQIIVFICGAVVMILELMGSRILAPYVGTSLYVWSALMGVILGALSLGYYLGGRLADARAEFKVLANIILLAAINISVVGFLKDWVAAIGVVAGIKLGSIMACLILFAPPSILLGMVSPYAIKLTLKNIKNIGNVAGSLYAFSTLGSIGGTFLAGFVLIPNFKITHIIFCLSLILFLIFLWLNKFKPAKQKILLFLIFLLWPLTIFMEDNDAYIINNNTPYSSIQVYDVKTENEGIVRKLSLNNEISSGMFLNDKSPAYDYAKYYRLDNVLTNEVKSTLCLGGGVGVIAKDYLEDHPDSYMDMVELDPEVIKVAQQYFYLEDNKRLRIFTEDARTFLNRNQKKYDSVYIDVFRSHYYIPWHLTTQEFFGKVDQSLNADGVVIINVNSGLQGKDSKFLWAEYKTLQTIFAKVFVLPVQGIDVELPQNVMLIASKNENAEFSEYSEDIYQVDQKTIDNAIVLTDDFAPVESYISSMID